MARRTRTEAPAWASAADDPRLARWRLERLWWWLLRFRADTAGAELRERVRDVAAPVGARDRFDPDSPRGRRSDDDVARALAVVEQGIDRIGERASAERFVGHLLAGRRRWARPGDFSHRANRKDHD